MNALLAIRPGPLRDGLDALLYTMPDVQLVAHPNDNNAVFDFCQKYPDALTIFEIPPRDPGLLTAVSEIRLRYPQGHVIAFINAESDLHVAKEARADLIVRVGTRASETRASIEELIRAS